MENDFQFLIGMTVEAGRAALDERDMDLRVRNEDGKALMGTTDMRTNRLNVSVTDGLISSIGRIG